MPDTPAPDPNVPPRTNEKEVEETINTESEVDEASFESFPASDSPAHTGHRVGPADVRKPAEGDRKKGAVDDRNAGEG